MIRTRSTLAAVVTGALALAACGGDDGPSSEPAPAVSDDDMSDDDMTDDDMADDDMTDDDMTDDDMTDDDMTDDDMTDDDMADDDMADDDMADDDMTDDDMADDDMADDDMSDDDMADDDMTMNDLMSVIINDGELSVLDDAIHAADLQDTLHDDGPFTIFAPTDAAFAAYLGDMGMTAEDAFADTEALTALLLAHVVDGADDGAMVMSMDGQAFTTLGGTDLTVAVDGETVTVGDATVLEYDVDADNGVIHIIDTVLAPAG